MPWSNPIRAFDANAHLIPGVPAVYRLRAYQGEEDGALPCEIPRCRLPDPTGTLLIGEGTNCHVRYRELVNALDHQRWNRGHGPGYRFYYWYRWHFQRQALVFEWADLSAALAALRAAFPGVGITEKQVCTAAETLLLDAYLSEHLDTPPVNRQGAKWRATSRWLRDKLGVEPAYSPEGRLNVPLIDVPGVDVLTVAEAQAVATTWEPAL